MTKISDKLKFWSFCPVEKFLNKKFLVLSINSVQESIGMETGLQRITFERDVLNGKPTIRGLRISVEMILELLAKGSTTEEILEDYPILQVEDIQAALLYRRADF
jgi:uncharacterized protein (DUF433 family)